MTSSGDPLIFDGHNDVLLKLWKARDDEPERLFRDGCDGHLDLPRARAGGFGGGFFAVYVPSEGFDLDPARAEDTPLPDPIPQAEALPVALAQAGILLRLQAQGALEVCTTAAAIETCLAEGRLAAVLHMEGAEAIDRDFRVLDVLHAAGLRSLGPVWSRPNEFGHGVPFRHPSTGDTGPGLTDLGRELVRQCAARRILIDVSHMTEAGFWDVAALTEGPLVATHSNAHHLCAASRNLSDRQLDAIRERDGMIGVNFATAFLRRDGRSAPLDTLAPMVRQFDYLIERVGERGVGFGSDFDGAMIPTPIGDVAGLPAAREALRAAGYGDALLARLCHGNWLRALRAVWGEQEAAG